MLSFLFLSFNAFSEDGKKGDGQNFEKAKSMMLENIEKRISNLQDVKSCVSSTSDRSALDRSVLDRSATSDRLASTGLYQ